MARFRCGEYYFRLCLRVAYRAYKVFLTQTNQHQIKKQVKTFKQWKLVFLKDKNIRIFFKSQRQPCYGRVTSFLCYFSSIAKRWQRCHTFEFDCQLTFILIRKYVCAYCLLKSSVKFALFIYLFFSLLLDKIA